MIGRDHNTGAAGRGGGGGLALAAACLAMLAVGINGTAVMAALPTIGRELALGPPAMAWVVNAYLVASAASIIAGGKAADRFGADRVSVVGSAAFAIASIAIASLPFAACLVAGRALQGIGAALAVPGTLALASLAAAPARRAAAIGAWTGFLMLGFSLGPLIGGVLTHTLGWRTIFWANAAIILLALFGLLLGRRQFTTCRSERGGPGDWPGLLLLVVFTTGLVFGLQALPDAVSRPVDTLGPLLLATAALAGLVGYERRVAAPLVDFAFFGRRNFSLGCAIGAIAMLGIITFLMFYNLFVQDPGGRRFTAIAAGLSLLPMSGAILALALTAPQLAARFGLRVAIGGGMLAIVAAAVLLCLGLAFSSPLASAAGLVAIGGGLATPYACAPRLALSALAPAQAGQGSGIISACTFLGGSIGVACGGVVYRLAGFYGVLGMLAALAAVGAALAPWIDAPNNASGSARRL